MIGRTTLILLLIISLTPLILILPPESIIFIVLISICLTDSIYNGRYIDILSPIPYKID